MNREISAEEKPFLTRFFNEVLNNVEIPYKEFDFSRVTNNGNESPPRPGEPE